MKLTESLRKRLNDVNYDLTKLTDEENELFSQICDIRSNVGKLARHYQGGCYLIVSIAYDSETEEELVVHKEMGGDYRTYVSTMDSFVERIDKDNEPASPQIYKFELIEIKLGATINRKI